MDSTTDSKAPAHLSREMKAWFTSIASEYVLESHHLRVLQSACESWDRCQQSRKMLKRDGLTALDGKGALKAHPAVAIERDSRLAFLRALRELGLDALDVESPRPALLYGGCRGRR
jgi:P27 family predicted phage terminase small subunit